MKNYDEILDSMLAEVDPVQGFGGPLSNPQADKLRFNPKESTTANPESKLKHTLLTGGISESFDANAPYVFRTADKHDPEIEKRLNPDRANQTIIRGIGDKTVTDSQPTKKLQIEKRSLSEPPTLLGKNPQDAGGTKTESKIGSNTANRSLLALGAEGMLGMDEKRSTSSEQNAVVNGLQTAGERASKDYWLIEKLGLSEYITQEMKARAREMAQEAEKPNGFDRAMDGIWKALTRGADATGEALGDTVHEFATNKQLHEGLKFGGKMALLAALLPTATTTAVLAPELYPTLAANPYFLDFCEAVAGTIPGVPPSTPIGLAASNGKDLGIVLADKVREMVNE